MTFLNFAQLLQQLEQISSRNEMTGILATALPRFDLEEVDVAMYMLQGQLAPTFRSLEFNLSQKLALRAIQDFMIKPGVDGQSESGSKIVTEKFSEFGDLGLVVESIKQDDTIELVEKVVGRELDVSSVEKLSIVDVHEKLKEIAHFEGPGSQENKMKALAELLLAVDSLSARYIARIVIGKLRLGLSDKTVLDAFSVAIVGDKSMRKNLERAFGARADIGKLAQLILGKIGNAAELERELEKISLVPGVPVASKLVEREKLAQKVFERLSRHIVQPKLDGMRAQIHYDKQAGVAEVFSRNMERLTDMFPDILEAVARLGVDSAIIDSEVIGYDFENDNYLPFQETMQRRRKHDIDEAAAAIPVRAMAFDLLYLNGADITQIPVQERVAQLSQIIETAAVPEIKLLDSPIVESAEELDAYFRDKIGQGLEGVICKKLDTAYEPGTRNFDWIKLKANTQSDMVDTLDVVVIGYYTGRGARAKFGIGALLTAVYNAADEKFYSVAKVGSGFTDADLEQISKDLTELKLKKQPDDVVVNNQLKPDVWIRPQIVIEIEADEITRSPGHTAAAGQKAEFETHVSQKGLSLRFPRLKVWNRDKNAEQATSVEELLRIYHLRKSPNN